jgi:hypothetical protein
MAAPLTSESNTPSYMQAPKYLIGGLVEGMSQRTSCFDSFSKSRRLADAFVKTLKGCICLSLLD